MCNLTSFLLVLIRNGTMTEHISIPGVRKDKTLRQIARKVGSKQFDLGIELDLDVDDIRALKRKHKDAVDLAFYMLLVRNILFHYPLLSRC